MRKAGLWPDNRKGQAPVIHGFRAVFKTWCEDHTQFNNGVVETAMLHKVGGKVEQSYMRGQLFEKRRELMQAWGKLLSKPWVERTGNVERLRQA